MKKQIAFGAMGVAGLILVAGELTPADAGDRGTIGPDVIASRVGSTNDFVYEGQSGGISAFSIASTSCNLGDQTAEWIDGAGGRNPVIAQQLYRLSPDEGRIEQLGYSWLKYSFCAVNENFSNCGTCAGTSCNTLGIGCADTYWAGLNDGTSGGPRWDINPVGQGTGGVHDDQNYWPSGPSAIKGRLQVKQSDIVPGARYFAEIQYVTHDEALDKRWNNATYREVNLSATSMSAVDFSLSSHQLGDPAIQAWQDENPDVGMTSFDDDPGVGRFNLAYLVTDNGDGTWTYEYALHNLNSHRAANLFSVPVDSGVDVSSTGFHDIDYHSNDGWNGTQNFDGTDWPAVNDGSSLTWETDDFATDPNANALRWGTMYNYRFTADAPPVDGSITVGMYRDGGRPSVAVAAQVPGGPVNQCPADIAEDDSVVDVFDLLELLAGWGSNGAGADLAKPNNVVDVFDLLELLAAWGPCDG